MQDIRDLIQPDLDAVNALIIENLESDVDLVENIGHYIVDAGGKRLRPILALLAARCLGYEGQQHIRFATVVEFIHTATLLHDDVVDLSSLRRGRPTANAAFGNASSVLVGDFIYTRAFQLMVEIGDMDIMQDMARTTNLIAEGEVLQLVRAGDPDTTEAQYLDVIRRKTAVLFSAACRAAAPLEARPELAEVLASYGMETGVAFQVIDDVLDYEGDPEAMGKNVGDDLAEGKPTLPLIHVMREGGATRRELVARAIRDKNRECIDEVLQAVRDTGSLEYARDFAAACRDRAVEALDSLPESAYRDAMASIADLAINRQA